jgi:hypothetical protein
METPTNTGGNPCFQCRAGHHGECFNIWHFEDVDCCCGGEITFTATGEVKHNGEDERLQGNRSDAKEIDTGYISDGYDGNKSLADYKDPISTGRKRAAEMYPIHPGMVCEWAGLRRAGGGVVPIVGCVGRPASDRHHGPDKNTMNNAPLNMHRICDYCHNTWHAVNDPHYGERPEHTQPFIPKGDLDVEWFLHDAATKASMEEIIEAETKRIIEFSS